MRRIFLLALLVFTGPVWAGEADVIDVKVRKGGDGSYSFDVTVRHGDTGWKHYANKWDVVSVDGKTVFGTRTLFHPHETEQPFTRSLSGVKIPAGQGEVVVRAHDSAHGYGGATKRVPLDR